MKKKRLVNNYTLLAIGAVVFILCLMLFNVSMTQNRFVENYSSKIDEIETKLGLYDEIILQNAMLIEENNVLTAKIEELELLTKEYSDTLETDEILIVENTNNEDIIDEILENAEDVEVAQNIEEATIEEIPLTEELVIPTEEDFVEESINEIVLDTDSINFTDITKKSGMTAEGFDLIIEEMMNDKNKPNSKLIGMGKYLVEMEETYDVNGFFALGVSSFESGWGERYSANTNNLFGFSSGKMKMSGFGDSIIYFGQLMTKTDGYYFARGKTTISSISSVYCPPNHTKWATNINWMIGYYQGLTEKLLM